MKRYVLLILFVLLLFGFSINQKLQWKGTIEEEKGVKVIRNPREPLYGEIAFELEEDLSIGNEEDEDYTFYDSASAIPDSGGNIFVLDYGNFRVQKYDKGGNYLLSFGQKGQGPGEFQGSGINFCVDANDNVLVRDYRRIHTFNNNGEFLNTITFIRSGRQISDHFRITKVGNILGRTLSWGDLSVDGPQKSNYSIILVDSDGNLVKTIATYRSEEGSPLKVINKMWFTPPNHYTARLHFCPLDEELSVFGHGSEYKLTVIDSSGEIVNIIEKEVIAQPVTKEDKKRVLDQVMARQKMNTRWENKFSRGEVEKAMKFPKYKPFFDGITSDSRGRIYVKKFKTMFDYEIDKNNHYDLYNKDGYYLYKVVIPIRWVLIRYGCIYTTEFEQETGYARIKRYRIKNWNQVKEGIN